MTTGIRGEEEINLELSTQTFKFMPSDLKTPFVEIYIMEIKMSMK